MTPSRLPLSPSRALDLQIPRVFLPFLVMAAIASGITIAEFVDEHRNLRDDLSLAQDRAEMLEDRERELMATIARQHRAINEHIEGAEALSRRLEAVEMQLDGVEHLGRELRAELGLPDDEAVTAQGGAFGQDVGLGHRADLARERLAESIAALIALRDNLREQREAEVAAVAIAPRLIETAALRKEPPDGWPIPGDARVTSSYGWRVFRGRPNFHTGVDIGLPPNSDVTATADGVVIGAGWQPGYGYVVLLQHADGYNSLYAHLAGPTVNVGEVVQKGDVIGLSGSSGNSTGPHLHYEVWENGRVLDPGLFTAGAPFQAEDDR